MYLTYLLRKIIGSKEKRDRIMYERLTEPLHLNFVSLLVLLFGKYKWKIDHDLIIRQQFAFCLWDAARLAQWNGLKSFTAIEFGVGNGEGLLNMARIANKITELTEIRINIVGFDLTTGLPLARDYRDMPEIFTAGSFANLQTEKLLRSFPQNTKLIVGEIEETAKVFLNTVSPDSPIAFVSVDVDYYYSAVSCLNVLKGDPAKYLPHTLIYLDDITVVSSSPEVGELLAVNEFNRDNPLRKIHKYPFLKSQRIFKNARWLDQIYLLHVLDHEFRSPEFQNSRNRVPNTRVNPLI